MPVYRLPEELIFPPPEEAEEDGLLAVGGDLSIERILLAYHVGIFPWYSDGSPLLWWSPDPRLVHTKRRSVRCCLERLFLVRFFAMMVIELGRRA